MATELTVVAHEKGTYVINCAFTDEDGDAVVPATIVWSLTDEDGEVINNRNQVSVAVPASSVDIVLSGLDLAVLSGEVANEVRRSLIVEYTYNSTLGSDLPGKDEATFLIENLTKVT